ncbi:class I SAM-dependent methyltransferase [Nocardioides KLBMP 9356]|uniref:Class I SAM-dependent methyltransferase n=1 Tax=Nocardioides potassii TaxID=2911371 RepID=A0ABS9HD95_9ACTN|nr:class I SAM-dependent methyltransferase [Nocardioides potassii]MCF6378184.1 class I SAM-dependent methyltransferase [Nocardioides potassii]
MTPVGIAGALLDSVVRRLDAGEEVGEDLMGDLSRARDLVRGLDDYVARSTTAPTADLVELERRTRHEPWTDSPGPLEQEMLSGAVEGAFLRMLVAATGAVDVLEIGMFTGYSALAMAQALPDGGRVVACEIDDRAAEIARSAFAQARGGDRVDVRVGPAATTLRDLASNGDRFDLVFLDADKPGYDGYVRDLLDLDLLAEDGLLCIDNTLMQGEPWAAGPGGASANGVAITTFNLALAADERVEQVLVPLRDGVTLARRVRRP